MWGAVNVTRCKNMYYQLTAKLLYISALLPHVLTTNFSHLFRAHCYAKEMYSVRANLRSSVINVDWYIVKQHNYNIDI